MSKFGVLSDVGEVPPYMKDLAHLCHFFVVPTEVRRPSWMRTKNFKASHLVFLRLECDEELLCDANDKVGFVRDFFSTPFVPVEAEVCDRIGFWNRLYEVSLPRVTHLKVILAANPDPLDQVRQKDVHKLGLLVNVEQMADFRYPLPGFDDVVEGVAPVRPSRDTYAYPSASSPVFVVDCEMCQTGKMQAELTRVTLINEAGDIVIDSFVKPRNPIVDYVTCFSGVTEECLRDVSVRVEDVQDAFRRVLPPDAILVGHSIENDLMAMRMSHPYCIDVGLLYTTGMNRNVRKSLRHLALNFLGCTIQDSDKGHCSYEDCWATLQLLRLKLQHGSETAGVNLARLAADTQHDVQQAAKQPQENKKSYVRGVQLPPPRCVGRCAACAQAFRSQCCLDKCPCAERQPDRCIMCVGKEVVHEELHDRRTFNFGHAMSIFSMYSANRGKTPLVDVLGRLPMPSKRVLIARYLDRVEAAPSTPYLKQLDVTPFESADQVKAQVLDGQLLEHDLCLLEVGTRAGQAHRRLQVDCLLRHVHQVLAPKGMLVLLMCTTTRAVIYFGVKS